MSPGLERALGDLNMEGMCEMLLEAGVRAEADLLTEEGQAALACLPLRMGTRIKLNRLLDRLQQRSRQEEQDAVLAQNLALADNPMPA